MYRFYNSALFITTGNSLSDQSISGAIKPLNRVQSVSLDLTFPNLALQYLDSDGEFCSVERPMATVATQYYLNDGNNESLLGFGTGMGTNILRGMNDEKNLYIVYTEKGLEPNLYSGNNGSNFKTLAIGNAVLTNYSLSADTKGFMGVSCTYQALNLLSQTGLPSGQQIPTVDLQSANPISGTYQLPVATNNAYTKGSIAALGGKNITMNFPSGSIVGTEISGNNAILLQGFNFGLNFNRISVKSIGNALPKRQLQFPIEVTFNASAVIDQYRQDQLLDGFCNDSGINFNVVVSDNCTKSEIMKFTFANMTLESQNMAQSIETQNTMNINWKGYIYNFYNGSSVTSSGDFSFEFSNEFI